ncbi:MAG: hypothetical protein K9M75_06260 [Phycisphaerae bacterium]|nr:hypothetical protein [Phycisphaerae bacterium]
MRTMILLLVFIWFVISGLNVPLFADTDSFSDNSYTVSAVPYKLVEGSFLVDDTDLLDRPTLMSPVQGSFYLKRINTNPLFTNYAICNFHLSSTATTNPYKSEFTEGTYQYGGEVALTQRMTLKGHINDSPPLLFDSGFSVPTISYPWIEIDLVQVDPKDPLQYFRLHLVAVPWPRLLFSTSSGFTASSGVKVSQGDLISTSGRVIRKNNQLTARLGIMPVVPDLGLDAVMFGRYTNPSVASKRCHPIWFSITDDVFSETLGPLHKGDLLSEQGAIIKSYIDLIGPFMPMPPVPDVGLDAAARTRQGELLFSSNKDFFSENRGITISNGDLLSEKGYIFRTNADLLSRFDLCPTFAPVDAGLDAVFVWPHGEVWFSTKTSLCDVTYGMIGHGDLLSSYGKVIARNRDLVKKFEPMEDLDDFGLDGLQILWPNLKADLNEDGVVNLIDFSIFAQSLPSKVNDSLDNTFDLYSFSEEWLRQDD